MPVLARALPLPPIPPDIRPSVSWTDPDGGFWDLSTLTMPDGLIATSLEGIGAPPVALTTIPLPSGAVNVQSLLPQPHQIIMGLYAEGSDTSAFHTLVSQITRAFWTVRRNAPAPGLLTIRQKDGTARQISCYVTSGQDQPSDPYPLLQATWTLSMQGDPYWTDQSPQPVLTFGPSQFGSVVTVDNDGDAETYPIWTISGPGTPTITNATTGKVWSFSTPVPSGARWTVVCAPDGGSSVTDQNGVSQWPALAAGIPRDLWPLISGNNEVFIEMTGASAASQVTLQFTRKWLRA